MAEPDDPLTATAPWARLHAALMPDYNRQAGLVWTAGVVLGGLVAVVSLLLLARQGGWALLQAALALGLAVAAAWFPVRVPGTRHSYTAGEVFLFLALLQLGVAAAVVVAAGAAFVGSLRTSRRWTSRLFSPASAALAMAVAGSAMSAAQPVLAGRGLEGPATLLALALAAAALYFVINASLVAGVLQLKRGEPFWQLRALLADYRWVGLADAGSAALATLLFVTWRAHGAGAPLVMVPLLGLLLLTLHYYYRQQETGLALREAQAAAAAREAEAAAAHLRALEASERRFHGAFTHAGIGMALLGFDGRVLMANPAFGALVGTDAAALAGLSFLDFAHPDERRTLERQLGLGGRREFEGFSRELRCQHAGGGSVWLALHAAFFTEPATDAPCLIVQAQDVSARRAAEAGLAQLAYHDALTGLPNRRRFMECLDGAVARSRGGDGSSAEGGHRWALMFIDFDRFKQVNDTLGHAAGDALLQQLARRLQERLRPSDVVARLGGDEFAVLLEHLEHERDAVQTAERLMEALKPPFAIDGQALVSSASIGITFSAFGYDSAEQALRDADTAMFRAKAEGRSRLAVYDRGLHEAVSARLRLEGELREAIGRGEIEVAYQPLFRLGGDRAAHELVGFEALLRWRGPDGVLREPASFLPLAEQAEMLPALTDFVLLCACRQLRQWQQSAPALEALTLAVNLAAAELRQPGLVARVSRALVESGLRPAQLTLEITEAALMDEPAAATLTELAQLGVQLAVDDFGSGASSIDRLAELPIHSLKIDRRFVRRLEPGRVPPEQAAVVASIVQLGSVLRKAVVAEGIETAEQVQRLRELGCELGQGFHLASPLAASDAAEWLAARQTPMH